MPRPESERRLKALMERYLGGAVMKAFADPDVTEVYVNPHENRLRLDTHSRGRLVTEHVLRPERTEQFLNAVATLEKKTLGSKSPSIQAKLPMEDFGGARLQGFVPPLSQGPSFVIRKLAGDLYPLASYVAAGIMTEAQHGLIKDTVTQHGNILVIGSTNSGKTTLCNAIIQEVTDQFPDERLVILEDTGELQCSAPDHLMLSTWEEDGEKDEMVDLVFYTLRANPNRILIGEVRDHSAYRLLDAWSSGHPGGCCTVHADTIQEGLSRLGRLARDAGVPDQTDLIKKAIDLAILIKGAGARRRIADMARVVLPPQESRFNLERPSQHNLQPAA